MDTGVTDLFALSYLLELPTQPSRIRFLNTTYSTLKPIAPVPRNITRGTRMLILFFWNFLEFGVYVINVILLFFD